jgi:hypothetical protein
MIDPTTVIDYLKNRGWQEKNRSGERAELWFHDADEIHTMSVPLVQPPITFFSPIAWEGSWFGVPSSCAYLWDTIKEIAQFECREMRELVGSLTRR